MRLIDADAAIESLTEYGNGRAVYIGVEEAVRRIEQLPSAQPSDNKIENAIRVLQSKYNKALSQDYIRNPIAWALYQTWKEFDR